MPQQPGSLKSVCSTLDPPEDYDPADGSKLPLFVGENEGARVGYGIKFGI